MISDSLSVAVCEVASQAGQVILEIYDQAYEVIEKADGSPVTVADHRAHDLISEQLAPLLPGTPLLSEESAEISYQQRADWLRFWLVDPLDGTKEFIRRNGEFTVNIALIEDGVPILGVVHTPVRRMTHFAVTGGGAWRQVEDAAAEPITIRPYLDGAVRMVASRSHSGAEVDQFRDSLRAQSGQEVETVSMGSALKVCLVAEGVADVYPRLGPTSEWDTGASHCILNEAGGRLMDCAGNELQYNKPTVLNPWFLAVGDTSYDWINVCPELKDRR
ncbi:MAG TPA: 3'(2'),5'-bisphosphate nucleotidase [Gammaproteobacteria bacterium]|jgi:3'(2'), 5'-bisphosphate nucleotidase|nr:3'(2'),5'-bisphosphate nucleotidase CysQ [Gammaproteobacteria bacterium]RTZ65452.1 MAG: 3'(2'),5'-bisphosphate nucleotidase [Gammaproteobacteria bacterium]HAD38199.1 3'(2'),5'-bisphosphate nucleotidase [Gammaproteobacteria bacterium]HBK75508.1 3'(2'),5'-bisphosphate nucleotidase [Gammaproteobacteria bacterium]HIM97285.1 3'(2'),5'-bisphosphate nucleotidase [Gammaproteobacteria bacterium]